MTIKLYTKGESARLSLFEDGITSIIGIYYLGGRGDSTVGEPSRSVGQWKLPKIRTETTSKEQGA